MYLFYHLRSVVISLASINGRASDSSNRVWFVRACFACIDTTQCSFPNDKNETTKPIGRTIAIHASTFDFERLPFCLHVCGHLYETSDATFKFIAMVESAHHVQQHDRIADHNKIKTL